MRFRNRRWDHSPKSTDNPIAHRSEDICWASQQWHKGQRAQPIYGPGHHCVVAGPDGKLWMVYHQKYDDDTDYRRFSAVSIRSGSTIRASCATCDTRHGRGHSLMPMPPLVLRIKGVPVERAKLPAFCTPVNHELRHRASQDCVARRRATRRICFRSGWRSVVRCGHHEGIYTAVARS